MPQAIERLLAIPRIRPTLPSSNMEPFLPEGVDYIRDASSDGCGADDAERASGRLQLLDAAAAQAEDPLDDLADHVVGCGRAGREPEAHGARRKPARVRAFLGVDAERAVPDAPVCADPFGPADVEGRQLVGAHAGEGLCVRAVVAADHHHDVEPALLEHAEHGVLAVLRCGADRVEGAEAALELRL